MLHAHLMVGTPTVDALGATGLTALYRSADAALYAIGGSRITLITRAGTADPGLADAVALHLTAGLWRLTEMHGYSYGDCPACLFDIEDFELDAATAEISGEGCGALVASCVNVA